jgi:hypothetical protein
MNTLELIDTHNCTTGVYTATLNYSSGRVVFSGTVSATAWNGFTIYSDCICQNDTVEIVFKTVDGTSGMLLKGQQNVFNGSVCFYLFNVDGNDTTDPITVDFMVWTKFKN